jgi:GNAT superfamily N-acetyltransferase
MQRYTFRPLRKIEANQILDLLLRNDMPFDPDYVTRQLELATSTKNTILGCFDDERLVGMYSAYHYRIFLAPTLKDAARTSFITVDRAARGKGLAKELIEQMAKYAAASGLPFVSAFVDTKLGKWADVINNCWRDFGYKSKSLGVLSPCFKRAGAELTCVTDKKQNSLQVKKLSEPDMEEVIDFCGTFCTRYSIAEIPDENSKREVERYPDKYHWFSIEDEGNKIGYVSGFTYSVCKRKKMEKQLHFNHLIVDKVYVPNAVNSVVHYLENSNFRPHVYVINNSHLVNNEFLYKTGFRFGFFRMEQFLRYRQDDPAINTMVEQIDGNSPFSLTIL